MVTKHVNGSFNNPDDIQKLADLSDTLTVEIEHINTEKLFELQRHGKKVSPDPQTLKLIQDKFVQKTYLKKENPGIPISEFIEIIDEESLIRAGKVYGYPLMLKSKTMAYDGRGNKVVKSESEVRESIQALGGGAPKGPELYAEKWVEFKKELAVMVAKSDSGEIVSFPCVETIQKDSICHLVIAPAPVSPLILDSAKSIAEDVVRAFPGSGIFGVELFLLKDGSISFNEVAPRPHNSGHYTIEACNTSQFEQHIRCITGLPLGNADLKVGASVMINIIGKGEDENGTAETMKICHDALKVPGATIHLYGKYECKKGRKMGHITLVGDDLATLLETTSKLVSDPLPSPSPLVSIIMGSDSDLPTVKPCCEILEEFKVPFEVSVVSAHRTPDRMVKFAKEAHLKGIKVIIAAAGGAAHLPGMVAAITPLPVIGIPVALKVLDGVDSLHSIVQMPVNLSNVARSPCSYSCNQ